MIQFVLRGCGYARLFGLLGEIRGDHMSSGFEFGVYPSTDLTKLALKAFIISYRLWVCGLSINPPREIW